MIRDQKSHVTNSQDLKLSKAKENFNPNKLKNHVTYELEANPTRVNNHGLVSFNSFGHSSVESYDSTSVDFLPSPSFDDLQTSIFSTSHNLHMTHDESSITSAQQNLSHGGNSTESVDRRSSDLKLSNFDQWPSSPRPVTVGDNFRRQSLSTQRSGISTTSWNTRSMEPSNTSIISRNRRHSQYPDPSRNVTSNTQKDYRKSVGPQVTDSSLSKLSSKRRPSSTTVSQCSERKSSVVKTQIENAGNSRASTVARATKTKSLPSPSKYEQNPHSAGHFDHHATYSNADRTYSRPNERGLQALSSRKRMSIVPGMPSPSHPTGLGARTISPTDARRAKRMSNMYAPPTVPRSPPTPHSDSARNVESLQSSSNAPSKVPTPSSSRTSPDPNRKCYNSRLSPAPLPVLNSQRDSTGSLQSRSLRSICSSRLPTSKPRNIHISLDSEEQGEEYVPPVPAIPKAFESPKEIFTDSPGFSERKSTLQPELIRINNSNPSDFSDRHPQQESQKSLRLQRLEQVESSTFELETDFKTTYGRKTLQPLRLPPFNLRPLSTNTANKVEAIEDLKLKEDHILSNFSRSSPITSSEASFGNLNNVIKPLGAPVHSRSNSALHTLQSMPTMNESITPNIISLNRDTRMGLPSVFSSLPQKKTSVAYGCIPRTKASDDIITNDKFSEQRRISTHNGPRMLNLNTRAFVREPPSTQLSNSDEPSTPLSASSLRRKLSLGWRRSVSKSSTNFYATAERDCEPQSINKGEDDTSPSCPPPSTALSNLGGDNLPSPSLSVKSTTYFDYKRKKGSISSLSMFSGYHERTISDSWGTQNMMINSSKLNSDHPASAPRTSSIMSRKLTSKNLHVPLPLTDFWTVDLDKDDLIAEEEMKKIASKRKDTERAARHLETLLERASAKQSISSQDAILKSSLNIFERGEILDYKEIYFCGTSDAMKHVGDFPDDKHNFGYDDDRGDYKIIPGDHIYYRYEIIDLLGKGSFGQVVRCVDHKTGGLVAVKIIRNKRRFHQQALVEVNILKKLREWDPKDKYNMVKFTQSFYFRRHLCISAELLDMNLYELIKSNSFRGFSLKIVRRFTKQILNSLLLLQEHKVIHCDLKPENVLLAHPFHTEIKVIDFGSSCFENEKVYTYIQSRFYRSPEVILGMTYGMPIDMWSLGCIMAELYSGLPIFPGENEQEQLACIMEVFGPPEKHLIEKSSRRKVFFDSLGKPRINLSSKGRRRRPSSKTLHQVLKCDDPAFLDFVSKCLKWDPDRRMKPEDAIHHEFITGQKAPPPSCSIRHTPLIRNESPMKRSSTLKSTFGNRPLPEPPSTVPKGEVINKGYKISSVKGSPIKNPILMDSNQRRQSTFNGNFSSHYSKRPANEATTYTGTSKNALPRAARNNNGSVDTINSKSSFFPRNQNLVGVGSNNTNSALGARRVM